MTPRILIAEDDNSIRCMLMSSLTFAGYSVSAVDNGLDLLRLASSSSDFDLIVTDMEMPKGEGGDIISVLRNKGVFTPAIVITAYRNLPLPADIPILYKPFNNDDLVRLIEVKLEAAHADVSSV